MTKDIQLGRLYKRTSNEKTIVLMPDYFIPLKPEIGIDSNGDFIRVYEGSFPGEQDERAIWRVSEDSLKNRYCLAVEEYE